MTPLHFNIQCTRTRVLFEWMKKESIKIKRCEYKCKRNIDTFQTKLTSRILCGVVLKIYNLSNRKSAQLQWKEYSHGKTSLEQSSGEKFTPLLNLSFPPTHHNRLKPWTNNMVPSALRALGTKIDIQFQRNYSVNVTEMVFTSLWYCSTIKWLEMQSYLVSCILFFKINYNIEGFLY